MNHSENRPHSWTDEDVEKLLTEFFDSEMPAALKTLPQERVERSRPVGKAQIAVLVVTALSVLAVAVVLDRSPLSPKAENVANSADDASGDDSRLATDAGQADQAPEASGRGYLVGAPLPGSADGIAIGPKPVERQGELPWTELRLHDPAVAPDNGSLPPELLIEIYPIEKAGQPPQ